MQANFLKMSRTGDESLGPCVCLGFSDDDYDMS